MDYKTLITNRRSIRDFTNRKVERQTIDAILQEVCMAPSASNSQPWKFVVITKQDVIKRISDESKSNLLQQIEDDPQTPVKKYKSILSKAEYNVFYNAPCLILIVGSEDYQCLYQDCSLAAAYLMFAATARDLGTCWIGLGEEIVNTDLRIEIGLAATDTVAAAIAIGYPVKIPKMGPRNPPRILKYI